MRIRNLMYSAFALLLVISFSGMAQERTVTKVVVVAKQKKYVGPCPAKLEFVGTIFVSHPAKVTYRWERSDGSQGPVKAVDIHAAGQGVTETWQLNKNFSGWMKLHTLTPTGVESPPAMFEVHCK